MKKGFIGFAVSIILIIISMIATQSVTLKDQSKIPEANPLHSVAPIPDAASPSPSPSTPDDAPEDERKAAQGADGHYAFATITDMTDRIYDSQSPSKIQDMDPLEVKRAITVATETYMDLNNTAMWNSHRSSRNDAQYFSDIVGGRGTLPLNNLVKSVVEDTGYLTEPLFLTMPGDGKIIVNGEEYTSAFTTPRKSFSPTVVETRGKQAVILTGKVMYEVEVYDAQNNLRTLMVDGDYGLMMVPIPDTGEWKVDVIGYDKFNETIK